MARSDLRGIQEEESPVWVIPMEGEEKVGNQASGLHSRVDGVTLVETENPKGRLVLVAEEEEFNFLQANFQVPLG